MYDQAKLEEMNAKFLKAHIEKLNENEDCKLVTDPAHWAEYGIVTPAQFDHYLAKECYINTYEATTGHALHNINLSLYSAKQIDEMTQNLKHVG